MHKVVEGLALQKPPLPIATLYRQIYRLAERQNERPPSYAVVYAIVHQLPADLVMLAHEGSKACADAFELVHCREAERPNAIWQADHTLLDILIRREDGTAANPWFPRVTQMTDGAGATQYQYQPPGQLGALKLSSIDGPYANVRSAINTTPWALWRRAALIAAAKPSAMTR